jgi:hypothetical protein
MGMVTAAVVLRGTKEGERAVRLTVVDGEAEEARVDK